MRVLVSLCLCVLASGACAVAGTAYRGDGYRFNYPDGWVIDSAGQNVGTAVREWGMAGRFTGVALSDEGADAHAIVLIRTDPHGEAGDEKTPSGPFRRGFCGPLETLLGESEIGPYAHRYPEPNANGYLVRLFGTRNLSHERECLQATIYSVPPGDDFVKKENSRRPHMASRFAILLFMHHSPAPTANDGTESKIGGNDQEGYLRSIVAFDTIVNSFEFTN
jgi:hypothetical protein